MPILQGYPQPDLQGMAWYDPSAAIDFGNELNPEPISCRRQWVEGRLVLTSGAVWFSAHQACHQNIRRSRVFLAFGRY